MGWGKRTLGDVVQDRIGSERFERMRSFRVRDALSAVPRLEDTVYGAVRLLERCPRSLTGHERTDAGIRTAVTLPAAVARYVANTSFYDWTVDALAQNLTSLPFIFNDKFAGHKTWTAAAYTRVTAFVGNSIIGKPIGDYIDWWMNRTDRLLNYKNDPNPIRKFGKYWIGASTAFATGQSWGYALFLKGGDVLAGQSTDWESVLTAVASLTLLAPIIGPIQERGYLHVRRWFQPTPPERSTGDGPLPIASNPTSV